MFRRAPKDDLNRIWICCDDDVRICLLPWIFKTDMSGFSVTERSQIPRRSVAAVERSVALGV
jgi:hypothetical protein